jgi:hypothetical protein
LKFSIYEKKHTVIRLDLQTIGSVPGNGLSVKTFRAL